MATTKCLCLFGTLVFAAVSTLSSATNNVPVLIWQSNGDKPLPSSSAGDHLSAKEFRQDVIDKLSSNGPVIVFMQDSLSLEDFTLYGNAYHLKSSKSAFTNLEKALQSYPSSLLPSVESPKEGGFAFSKNGQKVVSKASETELSAADRNSVVIFDLLLTASGADRQQSLQKNDQLIGRVMKRAKDLFPSFVAFYTAAKSSWIRSDDDDDVRMTQMTRRILALPSNDSGNYTGVFMSFGDCFLLYGKNLTFIVTTKLSQDSPTNSSLVPLEQVVIDPTSSCSENNTAIIILKYKNGDPSEWLQNLQLTLNFTRSLTGEWYLTLMNMVYRTVKMSEDVDTDLRTSDMWAPIGFSWNCGTARFVDVNKTYPRAELLFNKLQIQAFDVNEAFGDAYDCIGFFTIGIWMSIVSSLILIAILACGISMVMSINSMDRFDDPKGKTIAVSATD